jgi:Sucrose synthase
MPHDIWDAVLYSAEKTKNQAFTTSDFASVMLVCQEVVVLEGMYVFAFRPAVGERSHMRITTPDFKLHTLSVSEYLQLRECLADDSPGNYFIVCVLSGYFRLRT